MTGEGVGDSVNHRQEEMHMGGKNPELEKAINGALVSAAEKPMSAEELKLLEKRVKVLRRLDREEE